MQTVLAHHQDAVVAERRLLSHIDSGPPSLRSPRHRATVARRRGTGGPRLPVLAGQDDNVCHTGTGESHKGSDHDQPWVVSTRRMGVEEEAVTERFGDTTTNGYSMSKLTYRLLSAAVGIAGGIVVRALFNRVWHGITGSDGKPEPNDRTAGWSAVIVGAALEGALFAAVRATIDRAGAFGVAKATGTWPD
jgi:hypothetical protein